MVNRAAIFYTHKIKIVQEKERINMNTSFPRINNEVKEIIEKNRLQSAFETITQQPEEAFEGTVLEGKSRKYTILSHKDLNKYIDPFTQNEMWIMLDRISGNIEDGREKDGKNPFNSYLVINTDETYVNEVVEIMHKNGHWEGTTSCKKSLFEVIEEKQKHYYKLQNELRELITGADNVDVNYKGKRGIMIRIYTDSTADILLESDEGESYEQHVNLSDLY